MTIFKALGVALCAASMAGANVDTALEPQQPAPLQTNPKSPADHSTLLHPDQLQTLLERDGTVVSTNADQHTLTVKDMTDHVLVLQVVANTRILDPKNHLLALTDLKLQDHVRLYYDRKSNAAQQIDRLPSLGETILKP